MKIQSKEDNANEVVLIWLGQGIYKNLYVATWWVAMWKSTLILELNKIIVWIYFSHENKLNIYCF
jgi:hypothetical protein